MVIPFYHAPGLYVKWYLPRAKMADSTMLGVKKRNSRLWLSDKANRKQMGRRLASTIRQAKTNRSRLAADIGCTRQTLGYAVNEGAISLELLTEVVRRCPGASLDWIVLGRHPTADPEFKERVDQLIVAAKTLVP